jgi:hypothetical protein
VWIREQNTSRGCRTGHGVRRRSNNPIADGQFSGFFSLRLGGPGGSAVPLYSFWGAAVVILLVGLVLTGIWHVRIENARSAARRGIRFYQSGLERLDGTGLVEDPPERNSLIHTIPMRRTWTCLVWVRCSNW